MSEWEIFGGMATVLVVLIGIGTPIIKLNTSITKLTTLLASMDTRLTSLEGDNKDSHKRIWEHEDKQDDQLTEHDKRISLLEKK